MISYLPTFMPNRVLIIGGGGTGGRLVPLLAQFLKTCAWIPNPEITVVDDDVVEEKNLLRQNFIASDVGKPKAQVLAQRYSRAFNIPITPIVKRVTKYENKYYPEGSKENEDEQTWSEVFSKHATNAIVVMCVDSPDARRFIVGRLAAHVGNGNILLLDSGNENDFGQVSVSTFKSVNYRYESETLRSWGNTVPGDLVLPAIPINISYYEDMVAETTLSCADLDQTMAINCMMANLMFSIIQNFYYAKPISFHRLNVSLSHGITPEYMNPQFLIKNGTYADPPRLGPKFTNMGLYLGSVPIYDQIRDFHTKTMTPMLLAKTKAERDAKKAEEAKEAAIKEAAVKDAMAKYGWKFPGPTAADPTTSEVKTKADATLVKLLEKDILEKAALEKKPAVKRVKKISKYTDEAFSQAVAWGDVGGD